MDEQKDPMALWVGRWTPDDVIDRETRQLSREPRDVQENERGPAPRNTE